MGMVSALGVGFAVKQYADFEKAMSAVRANVDMTQPQFDKLSKAVMNSGAQFGFSAVETASAAEELGKAGISVADIMGGAMSGALTLAAAGEVSVGEAAETAATAMSMFSLKGKDVGRIADVLANGANKSTASVGSLSQALQQSGAVASSFGLTLEDTVATLAMFDQNGLKGSDAGTSLKTMLTALANPSKKAAEAMADLGLAAFDANGKFVGMASLQKQVRDGAKNLSDAQRGQAFATIFGTDAMRAANVLMQDTDGFDKWKAGVSEAGTAAKNAQTRTDNLTGDLKKLRAELTKIAIGEAGKGGGFLRTLTQGATGAVKAFSAIPEPLRNTGLAIAAVGIAGVAATAGIVKLVTATRGAYASIIAARAALAAWNAAAMTNITLTNGMTLAMGRFGTAVAAAGSLPIIGPTIAAMQSAFVAGAIGASRFATAVGLAKAALVGLKAAIPFALAAAAAFGAVKLQEWSMDAAEASHSADTLAKSLKNLAAGSRDVEAFKDFGKAGGGVGSQMASDFKSMDEVLERYKINSRKHFASINSDLSNWLGNIQNGNAPSQTFLKNARELDGAFAKMVQTGSAKEAAAQYKQFRDQIDPKHRAEYDKIFVGYNKALDEAAKKAAAAKNPTRQAADAITALGKNASAAEDDVKALTDALKGLGSAQLDERGSAREFQSAIDDASGALKENGKNLDITTEKGRKNQAALDNIAKATTGWAASVYTSTGSMEQANSVLESGRTSFINTATAMGMSADKAKYLADELFKLPDSVNIGLAIPGVENVITKLDDAGRRVYAIKGTNITIPVDSPGAEKVITALANVKGARQNADGSVTIPTNALTAPTIEKLKNVRGARINADGSVTISTQALNVPATIAALDSISSRVRNREQYITTYYQTKQLGPGTAITPKSGSIILPGAAPRATGGAIRGPGTGTSDDIPAWLSNGEHVLTAAEVERAGGQGAIYRMRAAIRAGALKFAEGGAVQRFATGGAASWSPDMSGIFALISNLTYDNEKSAWDKMNEVKAAIDKSKRDVEAARRKLAEDQRRKGVKASTILADQNRINDLLAKQLTTQRQLTAAQSAYNKIKTARSLSAAQQFSSSAGTRAAVNKKFVSDLTTIEKRGFPALAHSLAEQGDDEAARVAASFASSPIGTLRSAQKALTDSSAAKASLDALLTRTTPGSAAANRQQQLEANANALALRAANGQFANQSAVNVNAIVDTNGIIDGLARRIRVEFGEQTTQVVLPGVGVIATATTQHQATQASYGTTAPGVNL